MLKLGIFQPALPHYRVPVFNMLGSQPDIALSIFAPKTMGDIESAGGVQSFTFQQVHERAFKGGFFHQSAMYKILHPDRFDLVIYPWNIGYISAWSGLRKAKRLGIKTTLWGHGYSKKPGGRFKSWLRRRMGKRADGVLLYSKTIADRLIAENGFKPNKTFVAQNAIDHGRVRGLFREAVVDTNRLLKFAEAQSISPRHILIHVSRLCYENKPEMLIDAMPYILTKCPEANLVIIGDGEAMPMLRDKIRKLSLEKCVHMPGAIYDEEQLSLWMMNAHLFVYPCNIGLSLHKAFGYALPVVTDDNISGHNPEIEVLQDGVNGILYQTGNIESLANTCISVLTNEQLRTEFSQNAVRRVYDIYTVPTMVQGFLDLCQLVDGQRREVTGEANVAS